MICIPGQMTNFTAFAGLTIVSILAGIMLLVLIWVRWAKKRGERKHDTDEH